VGRLSFVPPAEIARILGLATGPDLRAAAFAAACRINVLAMVARAGSGHLGTSFSCLDIVAWLHLEEMRLDGGDRDVYFSSKGHDAPAFYAVLAGLGRLPFDAIWTLRRLGGLPGHPDVATPGVETNTGSLGMGVSKAKGMALAGRARGRRGRIFVLTGDGELQEGQLWESLPSAAHRGLGEITVVVDANQVQSDTWVRAVSDLGDLAARFRAFGWHVDRCDGHDMRALAGAFARLRRVTDRPKVLIADTRKGRGVSFMAPDAMAPDGLYRFHSGAPSEDVYVKALAELVDGANRVLTAAGAGTLALESADWSPAPAPAGAQRLVGAYARALVAQAEREPRLVVLDADLVLDCGLVPFRDRFPERFIECGIAEQDMVSQAGGLALRGLLPLVHSFACFLSARPNEQIYTNATERTKIVYVAPLAGLLPGGPGHSHQAVRDIAALGAVPGLVMLAPCTEREVELALAWCVRDAETSCYLRLTSIPVDVPFALPEDHRLEPGRGVTLREGGDAVVIAAGPVALGEAWRASVLLEQRDGLRVGVVNLPWLNRVDSAWLAAVARGTPWLFTLDDHSVHGGQGQMLLAALAELALPRAPRARRLGVTGIPRCGSNAEVLAAHGLDAAGIAAQVRAALVEPR